MAFEDAKHRPHAVHIGEPPNWHVDLGPDALHVELTAWGPKDLRTLVADSQANWGDRPMTPQEAGEWPHFEAVLDSIFAGKTLPQVLESLIFKFTIDGATRAFTHQIVRSRFASFMQHGGRDNDWRHRNWTMPETIRRAVEAWLERSGETFPTELAGRKLCITDWKPLLRAVRSHDAAATLGDLIEAVLDEAHHLYAALVDAGIPFQDARRVLPIGTQTYIHANYNYLALREVFANRLEHVMDWEINCVMQLMLREVRLNCPQVVWKYLGSRSDLIKQAAFAGLESWPPDGKYPVPAEMADRPRFHRAEQNPFWVLHPASWEGNQVRWIWTNGLYPHDILDEYFATGRFRV